MFSNFGSNISGGFINGCNVPIDNIVFGNFVGPVMEPLRMAEKSMGFSCGGMLYEKKQWEREREKVRNVSSLPITCPSRPGTWKLSAGKWFSDETEDQGIQTAEDSRFFGLSAGFESFSNAGSGPPHPWGWGSGMLMVSLDPRL